MRRLFLTALIFGVFIGLGVNSSFSGEQADEMKLYVGEPAIIPVSNPSRIVIANPKVADVVSVSKSEMAISPKAQGSTSLTYWDSYGEQSVMLRVFPENMTDAKRRIDNILSKLGLPDVSAEAQEEEGKVALLGRVKTSQERERILSTLGSLKDKVIDLLQIKEEEAAVEIDVQLLELSKGTADTLGLSWPGSISLTEVGSAAITGAGWANLFKISKLSRAAFTLKLDALVQEGKARILSRPRLTCQSGKEAELLVGGEKPILTTSIFAQTGATATEIEYKEYGIKLKIKPVVTGEDQVKLGLKVEVSEFEDTEIKLGSSTNTTAIAYPMTKRNVSTELFLGDGQTMSIGGLIKQRTDENTRRVPWFSKVPVVGLLFRQKSTSQGGGVSSTTGGVTPKGDTELFIILTPKIVKEKTDASKNPSIDKGDLNQQVSQSRAIAISDAPVSPVEKYTGIVQGRIYDSLKYPSQAKISGFQGTVKLKFLLSYRGKLLDAVVKQSSGYNLLDEDALAAARKISLYPPFPSSIDAEELWVDVSVAYRLE